MIPFKHSTSREQIFLQDHSRRLGIADSGETVESGPHFPSFAARLEARLSLDERILYVVCIDCTVHPGHSYYD